MLPFVSEVVVVDDVACCGAAFAVGVADGVERDFGESSTEAFVFL